MKLATYKNGRRDGRLMLVSRDLARAAPCAAAPCLQAALDDWAQVESKLQSEYRALNENRRAGDPFDAARCASPLPRAYQWADGSAYVSHVELMRKARGAKMPDSFWDDPLMYQGGSDSFLGPCDAIEIADEGWGIDLEAEIAVITDDTPMGIDAQRASAHLKLFMLVNDVSLRALVPAELAKGFGFFHGKPSSAFSPVAVTADELGAAWQNENAPGADWGKVRLPVRVDRNGEPLGRVHAGRDMTFNFPALIAHAAKTRPLCAGSIIGSGTISNKDADGGPGKPVAEGGAGYACVAEARMVETLRHGEPRTPFLRFGERVRIEMHDEQGHSIFGAIEQKVARYHVPPPPSPA